MSIAPVNTGLGNAGSAGYDFITLSIGGTFTLGSFVAMFVSLQDVTAHVSGITDDTTGGPMSFAKLSEIQTSLQRLELWGTAINGGKNGATYIRVNLDKACRDAAATCFEATGVVALGALSSANGSSANPSLARVMQDANNYWLAGFSTMGATLATSGSGTLERTKASDGSTPLVNSLVDDTAATAISITDAITRAATDWAALGIELRSTAGAAASRGSLTLLGVG